MPETERAALRSPWVICIANSAELSQKYVKHEFKNKLLERKYRVWASHQSFSQIYQNLVHLINKNSALFYKSYTNVYREKCMFSLLLFHIPAMLNWKSIKLEWKCYHANTYKNISRKHHWFLIHSILFQPMCIPCKRAGFLFHTPKLLQNSIQAWFCVWENSVNCSNVNHND